MLFIFVYLYKYINIHIFCFIYLHVIALLVQIVAFLLHRYHWSLVSVKSVEVLCTSIGAENKALVSLTLQLFGEYLAASKQM